MEINTLIFFVRSEFSNNFNERNGNRTEGLSQVLNLNMNTAFEEKKRH